MDGRPLNSQQPPLGCQRQESTATESVTATSVPWSLEPYPSHYQSMAPPSLGVDVFALGQRRGFRNAASTLPQSLAVPGMFSAHLVEGPHLPSSIPQGQLTEPAVLPYPPALFPPSLSAPQQAVQSSVNRVQYLEVAAHPEFENIMRAIFIGRQIGEDQEKQRLIADQHKRSMDSIHQARLEFQKHESSGTRSNPELDMLLHRYIKLVQGLNQELVLTQSEANNACSMFEQQIKAITNSASQMEGPVALSATDEDHLRQVLKRKYSDQIKHLSGEFRRKRKKGKLPLNATDVLRGWWENNLAWPYPSEDEKRTLAGQTDLSATQINNWFINQRKRHWHKFFKDGRLPQSPEEAVEILRKQGILQ